MDKARRSKALKKPVTMPDQLVQGVISAFKSMQKSDSASQNTTGIFAELLGGTDITTSEIGETKQSASEVITQSPVLTELEVLMQTMFPGGVTVEKLLEVKKIQDEREMSKKLFSEHSEQTLSQERAVESFPSSMVGQKVGTDMSPAVEREFTVVGNLTNSDHVGVGR